MRILFVTASRIGDAVLSTGLLAHLAETYPQARFTIACGAAAAPLFAAAPFVEKVIPMVKRKRAGHWRDLWAQTVGTWWSLVVDLRGSALGYLIPARRRLVLKSSWEPKHRLYHIASILGENRAFPPVLWNSPDQILTAARLLPPGPFTLALGPTANWGAKQWPADRFAQAARELIGENQGRIVVFGAESERNSVQSLFQDLPADRTIDLIGRVDLATVHACMKRCDLYLGNDSGLMHMAVAAGIPTIGLFGPSSEVFYGPFGPQCLSVRGPKSFEDICHAPDYDYHSQDCLMLDLEVGRVVARARGLLQLMGKAP